MKKKLICIIVILFGLILSLTFWKIYHINQQQIAVLSYHRIVLTEDEKDTDALTVHEFEEQLKYLQKNGYKSISPEEYYNWKEKNTKIPKKAVIITFDDGYYSFITYAKPLLDQYQFKATNFIIGEGTTEMSNEKEDRIGKKDIINHEETITYGSHTYGLHHQNEDGAPIIKSKTKEELKEDTKKFQEMVLKAEYLAYPYYTYTKDYIDVLKQENYKLAFAGEEEMATKKVNNYKIPRIPASKPFEEFKKIFETDHYKNKYGNGIIRKICVTINRKFHITL